MKKEWFRRFDFLNIPTSLSFKNEYFYATKVGAVLTIFFFFLIIILISYEIIVLYRKSSFKLITNQYTDLLESIDFSETPILFQITNSNNKIMNLDNKLFELIAYNMESYIEYYANGTSRRRVKNTIVELEQCDKTFSNKSEFAELNLSNYICIKRGQNMTAFGLLGDKNNLYKGLRVYINKCNGRDCYDDDVIEKQFHNSKFYLYYLGLSSNMFYLNSEDVKYQILTKFCSLSTNVLKKIVFTFDIGRFHLYNNILFKNNVSINYLLGNDYSIDVDIDPTSTLKADEYTIAYISFHYGGNIIETRKEVQTLFESLSIIGNVFNIILTIFKVINNYYSNKILFVDIFSNVFCKERLNFFIRNDFNLNNLINLNNKNNPIKKKNCDDSEQMNININNKNLTKDNSIKHFNNKRILTNDNSNLNKRVSHKTILASGKKYIPKRKSKTFNEKKGHFSKTKLIYYYILPFWILKRKKTFKNLYSIKDRICEYFSIEKINDLIKFKENLEYKSLPRLNNIESHKNNHNLEKFILDDSKNKNEKLLN